MLRLAFGVAGLGILVACVFLVVGTAHVLPPCLTVVWCVMFCS